MEIVITDGGRAAAGFKGYAGDCVTRAIAVATGRDYGSVYEDLFDLQKWFAENKRCRQAKHAKRHGCSPRNGVHKKVTRLYLQEIGWVWHPTMHVGEGCKVHLRSDELPPGRLIVSVSKHITCVIDGVLHDMWDCSRDGTRCVYGYWKEFSLADCDS